MSEQAKLKARELEAALAGIPSWYGRLHQALQPLDRHASRVLLERLERYLSSEYHGRRELWKGIDDATSPAQILDWAFIWSETKEGHRYWSGLYARLGGSRDVSKTK